ncbi:hypothetical protein [Lactiplantibacillus plantarum]
MTRSEGLIGDFSNYYFDPGLSEWFKAGVTASRLAYIGAVNIDT